MITPTNRAKERTRIHTRIRKKIYGSVQRPRLAVFRSVNHIYAQIIDDAEGRTLVAASTVEKEVRGDSGACGNVAAAKKVDLPTLGLPTTPSCSIAGK